VLKRNSVSVVLEGLQTSTITAQMSARTWLARFERNCRLLAVKYGIESPERRVRRNTEDYAFRNKKKRNHERDDRERRKEGE